ncbi:unnamed protein product [Diatraea saccharalis]|uniref:G-protein coupled receptors family 1 profile domain-containing protein n=1 Tax=Diatraea saccharalis TaxID=40085 RepID=A0A9N9RAG4_9NEOP|nr:unnamed protein product [Diatraea saccharalis]
MSNSNIFHYPNHTPRSKMIRRLPTQQSSDKGTSIMHKGIHVYILGAFILNNAASLEITEKNELITNILLTNIDHSKTTHSFIKQTAVRTDGNKLEQLKNSFDNNKTQEHLKDINKANDENYHEIAKRSIYLDYSYIDKEYGNNKTEKITPTVNSTTVDECVGLEDYCNMTKEDYVAMLQNYIYPQTYEWILIATHTTVFIIGLVGNALVCIAVYRNHTMRTVTNYFIVNLAAADFMVILFCLPPTVLWDVTETWFLGNTLCKMLLYFQCGPLVRHLLPTQVQVNNWTGQDSYSRHMGYIVDIQFSGADGPGNSTDGAASLQPAILSPVYGHLVSYQRSDLAYPQGSANLHTPTYKMSATSKFCAFARAHRSRERLGIRIPLFLMTIAYHQIVRVLWKNEKIPGQAETVKLASAEQSKSIYNSKQENSNSKQALHVRGNEQEFNVQAVVINFLNGNLMIGHSVAGDLKVLKLKHPSHEIRDIAEFPQFKRLKNIKIIEIKLQLWGALPKSSTSRYYKIRPTSARRPGALHLLDTGRAGPIVVETHGGGLCTAVGVERLI